jgi:phosphate transport system substrate-binding protein
VDIEDYQPFSKDNRLARPASPPSLRIASDYPRLDGAIGSYPLYAAVAQAVYAGLDEETAGEIVDCTNTVDAYVRLIVGEVDIFFGMAPSREQREYAAAKGLTLTQTPITKEAFVFFVHKDNPVRSLTQAQVRAVYSGRIQNWKELGGPDERILAFQRPEGSGSQTTMLRIMEGEAIARPLREAVAAGMADILEVVAYRNRKNALGYSFRWYATVLFVNPDIRLLAIDGIEPTPENIRSGAYPFTVSRLAVTARPLNPQSKSLIDWILGPEGQDLIARIGYVPLRHGSAGP